MYRANFITKYSSICITCSSFSEVLNKLKQYKSDGIQVLSYSYEKIG